MLYVFAAYLLIGIASLCPSVSFGDSGEFAAAAAVLGVAHAPGYPLFSLFGHAVGSLLPWGSWAYAVNLSSLLAAAAALSLFWDAVRRGCGVLGATVGVCFLGLSPLWLHTSLQAEVFALNGLAAAAALWVLCRFPRSGFDSRPMAALGLILGLGGANHQTLILVVPALLLGAWKGARPAPRQALRGLMILAAFGLLGLSVYAYLPIRAAHSPPLDWGHPVDWQSFLHVLLRRDYGSFSLTIEGSDGSRLAGMAAQTWRWLKAFYDGFGTAGTALAVGGLILWMRESHRGERGRERVHWSVPVVWIFVSGIGFLWLGNPPFDAQTSGALLRFSLLPWIAGAWLAARGALGALEFVDTLKAASTGRNRNAAVLSVAALLAAAPAVRAAFETASWNQRWDLAADDYGRNLLRSLPPGAAFFMDGGDDSFYTTAYLLYAEGRRPDLSPHDRGGLVFRSPYGSDFRRLPKPAKEERRREVEAAFSRRRPVLYATLRDKILPNHRHELWGLLRRVRAERAGADGLWEAPEGRALWEIYPQRFDRTRAREHYRYRALIPFYGVMRAAADSARGLERKALLRLRAAVAEGPDVLWLPGAVARRAEWSGYRASSRRDWAVAERAYLLAARHRPKDPSVRLNVGVSVEKQGRRREAESHYRAALGIEAGSFQARFNLGSLYWSEARWSEAAEMFEAALKIRPEDPQARRFSERARRRAGGSR